MAVWSPPRSRLGFCEETGFRGYMQANRHAQRRSHPSPPATCAIKKAVEKLCDLQTVSCRFTECRQPLGYSHFTVTVTVAECAVAPDVAVRLIVDMVPLLLPPLQEAKAKANKSSAKIPAKLNRRG